ncbi:hypothetical protein CCH79_00017602 [Gambusia affinis]|uniref:BAH domain-containing protein n=1 Tax=Gambusia affinis TaxID=33528 RepID=A0A315USA8_GAMAF|nr:hypothetical protein CCH79_00017602 [Gambusia affinis]
MAALLSCKELITAGSSSFPRGLKFTWNLVYFLPSTAPSYFVRSLTELLFLQGLPQLVHSAPRADVSWGGGQPVVGTIGGGCAGGGERGWVGAPSCQRGSYAFYKSVSSRAQPDGPLQVWKLGEFYFIQCGPEDPICIAEVTLLWEDQARRHLLASARLYFLPEDTPKGRTREHGERPEVEFGHIFPWDELIVSCSSRNLSSSLLAAAERRWRSLEECQTPDQQTKQEESAATPPLLATTGKGENSRMS